MSESKNLKDRDGRGGKDQRSRADEKVGSGPKGKKSVIVQPDGSTQRTDAELAQRGMTSELGREHWKRTGLKVPTDSSGHHHSNGGKKT
jgi:hypothetical protein